MNKAINFLLVLCLLISITTSCEKEPILEVSQSSLSFTDQGGTLIITFSTRKDWTASLTGGNGWCTISPGSGSADVKSITVTIAANDTYDDRSATILIKTEDLSKEVTITQQKIKSIVLTNKKTNLSSDSQKLEVEFKTSLDFEVVIPEQAKSWVTYNNTKSLRTEKIILNISENSGNQIRTAEIDIINKASGVKDTYTIIQHEKLVYYVEKMGTLVTILNQSQKDTISKMIVRGEINKNDFEVMKSQIPNLAFLNLQDVRCEGDSIPFAALRMESYTYSKTLSSIILPTEITSIGDSAFYQCRGLTSITIPDGVTSIGKGAFWSCSGLKSISFSTGLTSIGEEAFIMCHGLTSISIPSKVTSISKRAFRSCTGLTSITFPTGLTSIGDEAFFYCRSLTSITLPAGLTSIGGAAFDGCSSLTSLTIPDGVTSIGRGAFTSCSGLKSVTLPAGITSVAVNTFYRCLGLTSITIPDGVTSIGDAAFYGCSSLTSITLPTGLATIGSLAFSRCSSLTSITLPTGLATIGSSAFSGCSSLTSLELPARLTILGDRAFSGCSSLTSITLPVGITRIYEVTFYNCSGLTSITLPTGVTSIGRHAFSGCSGLTSITIPTGVTSIGEDAFSQTNNLREVRIHAITPPSGNGNMTVSNIILYVPNGAKNTYLSHTDWKNFNQYIEI